jgi:hypothetical protein
MTEHKIKWSHSSLKDYEGCARRYHEVKVLNNYPFQETEQTRYGKELHKAAEDYVKDGTPIPKQFEFVAPVIDALMAKPGRKFPEHEMGLTIDLKPCNFKDGAVWVRGIAVSKLSSSFEHNTWNPTQSALCNWCPVRTCELHPKH